MIKRDSELFDKINNTTQILVENLNETKISNVVKENHILLKDQQNAISKIQQMIQDCSSFIVDECWGGHKPAKQQNKGEEKENSSRFSNLKLSDYLFKLTKLVDQTKNRIGILEEENQFLRNEYTKVSKVNIQLNTSCL